VARNVDWLAGSGVAITDGVLCDATGRTSIPGVYAAGDVAAWLNPLTGAHEPHEHWTRAGEQARAVAASIVGGHQETGTLPPAYFWSDQYGLRIQGLGVTVGADTCLIVHGDVESGTFVALYSQGGRVTGAVGVNAARVLMRYRGLISARAPFVAEDLLGLAS
jgi:NADPH-dependent 2,4-dienoyl-CoA reductase/sulfur reductase-like enzyme